MAYSREFKKYRSEDDNSSETHLNNEEQQTKRPKRKYNENDENFNDSAHEHQSAKSNSTPLKRRNQEKPVFLRVTYNAKSYRIELNKVETVWQLKQAVFDEVFKKSSNKNDKKIDENFMVINKKDQQRLFSKNTDNHTILSNDDKRNMLDDEKDWELNLYSPSWEKRNFNFFKTATTDKETILLNKTLAWYKLQEDLDKFKTKKKCLMFIGIGSCNNIGGKDSCYRQQYPSWLEKQSSNFNETHILLIDDCFNCGDNTEHILKNDDCGLQIYDYEHSFKLIENNLGIYQKYFNSEKNIWLHIYSTHVKNEEYAGQSKTLADRDLIELGECLSNSGGAIVSGNFYAKNSKPHISIGIDENEITHVAAINLKF